MKYLMLCMLLLLYGCTGLRNRAAEHITGQKPAIVRIDEQVRHVVPKEEIKWEVYKWGIKVNIPINF